MVGDNYEKDVKGERRVGFQTFHKTRRRELSLILNHYTSSANAPLTSPVSSTEYELFVVFMMVSNDLQTGLPVVIKDVRNPNKLRSAQIFA